MALDSTVGGANANSYASVAEADAYMDTLTFRTAWPATGTSTTAKEGALQQAARYLNGMAWKGYKATYAQALDWPRWGALDHNGYAIPNTSVPTVLKNAQCELALRLISGDRASEDARLASRVKVGAIEAEYSQASRPKVITSAVMQMLAPLLIYVGGARVQRS